MHTRVIQLLVDNTSGVLSRISGLFSRRGYNIESITAGVTAETKNLWTGRSTFGLSVANPEP